MSGIELARGLFADVVAPLLARELPETYAGAPVRFATTWDPQARHGSGWTRWAASRPAGSGSIRCRVCPLWTG